VPACARDKEYKHKRLHALVHCIEIESTTSNGYMFVNSMFYAALLQYYANRVLFIDYYYVGKNSTTTYVRT